MDHHEKHVTIIVDIIHVIHHLWIAVWCFYAEGDREAEEWVKKHIESVLDGKSSVVAAVIGRSATAQKLDAAKRKNADTCANYLLKYKPFLRYDEYLTAGMPIATGVIEGACRYLVKDRMDITGARWSTDGAESVLQMRALRASGDINKYWEFYMRCEYSRNHAARYARDEPPAVPRKHPDKAI